MAMSFQAASGPAIARPFKLRHAISRRVMQLLRNFIPHHFLTFYRFIMPWHIASCRIMFMTLFTVSSFTFIFRLEICHEEKKNCCKTFIENVVVEASHQKELPSHA
jgi:hypothetical protein